LAKALHERAKNCQKLKDRQWTNIEAVKLGHISIGDLRLSYSPHHKPLPPTADEEVLGFKLYPSPDDGKPLLFYGSDNHLVAVRVRSKNPDAVKRLAVGINNLLEMKKWVSTGIRRGSYKSIHLSTWAPYMPEPQTTAEQREAGAAASDLLAIA
jgi:hypothetical protein